MQPDKPRRIILVPIDNRPVTYAFPQLIARVAGVDAVVPPSDTMGSSKAPANIEALSAWLHNTIKEKQPDCLAVCMDSIIYGGLVASRRSNDSLGILLKRAESIAGWKQLSGAGLQVLAQSSIMRISDNYYNNAEKPYWSECGREIFLWSQLLHKQKKGLLKEESQLIEVEGKISPDVRKDYLATRERNFQVNLKLVDYVQSKCVDFLIFSQDDTGSHGFNVSEKEDLLSHCSQSGLSNVLAYVGTDEVLMMLLCRALSSWHKPRCSVHFNVEQGKNTASNYEGQTIEASLNAQLAAAAFDVVSDGSSEDFAVVVHAAKDVQGDHIWLSGHPDHRTLDTTDETEKTVQLLEKLTVPCIICDVAYANGSDPLLVEQLMRRKDLINKLWGYAGWNTTGNTIGTALAMGTARWYAQQQQAQQQTWKRQQAGSDTAFKQAMFVRFADDWAYQTQVRPQLSEATYEQLNQLMMPYLDRLATVLDFKPRNLRLKFPWQRTFEVEVDVSD